jgi:hypothetical protein
LFQVSVAGEKCKMIGRKFPFSQVKGKVRRNDGKETGFEEMSCLNEVEGGAADHSLETS